MACRNRGWMTFIAIFSLTSMLPSIYAVPLAAGNYSTTKLPGNQSKSDCLYNQYLDIINLVCVNCTDCQPGEEHSSQQNCGFGEGGNTTCILCEKEYYQSNAGYSLKCSRCVTCFPNAEVLQECSATQNRECGKCPENHYEYQENVCLECTGPDDHKDCAHITPEPPLMNQSTPPSPTAAPPLSSDTLPTTQPSSSLPSRDMTGTTNIPEITESVTTKDLGHRLGIGAVISIPVIVLLCVVFFAVSYMYNRKRTGTPSSTTNPSNASYKPVQTINRDQPSTSSAADPGIECAPSDILTGTPSAGQENQHLLKAGPPVNPSVDLPSDVTNESLSLPHTLSISGGVIRRGIGMFPHLGQGAFREPGSPGSPGSPDSAKVNFSFENDDDSNQNGSCPEPMALRSGAYV